MCHVKVFPAQWVVSDILRSVMALQYRDNATSALHDVEDGAGEGGVDDKGIILQSKSIFS